MQSNSFAFDETESNWWWKWQKTIYESEKNHPVRKTAFTLVCTLGVVHIHSYTFIRMNEWIHTYFACLFISFWFFFSKLSRFSLLPIPFSLLIPTKKHFFFALSLSLSIHFSKQQIKTINTNTEQVWRAFSCIRITFIEV